jgi:prolyl-tRNA editing enzyme YbaK/EbsC (Cys-tRNA(Pro) deacylase)
MKKHYQVYISEEAKELKLIYINAGARGLLVGLSPQDLSSAIQGTWAPLI